MALKIGNWGYTTPFFRDCFPPCNNSVGPWEIYRRLQIMTSFLGIYSF